MISNLSLYQKSKNFLWTDKHISKQMLRFHLDTNNDAATRTEESINKTVNWITQQIPDGCRIIDLGCGPGLYTEKFAKLNYDVTGIDISKRSIKYAKKSAKEKKLIINYYNQSYLLKNISGKYTAALCIYCDFGALIPHEQHNFLKNVYNCLNKDGILIFDVFGDQLSNTKKEEKNWEYFETESFWSRKPHYVLYECKYFPNENTWGTRNIVIDNKKVKEFITWDTLYNEEKIRSLLVSNGFKLEGIKTGLVQENSFTSNDVMFVKAKKI